MEVYKKYDFLSYMKRHRKYEVECMNTPIEKICDERMVSFNLMGN